MRALLESFRARCQAVAADYALGKVDLITAVDQLQAWAFTRGLVDELGQDAVQAIMAEALAPVRELVDHIHKLDPSDEYEGLSSTLARACQLADAEYVQKKDAHQRPSFSSIPDSTLDAASFLIQQNDPTRLRAWLKDRDAGAIWAAINNKKKVPHAA